MDFAPQRQAMVAALRARQDISEPVVAAMLAVPRHLFLPGVDPEHAYRDEAIVTKVDDEGRPISSSSQPAIMAVMLDQLGVAPGHRVLEIGAGTGYNAALLDRLTGPEGRVVSVDIDADTVAQAAEHLAAAGARADVVQGDGGLGWPELAPYDRLIATVGVWDLTPAWLGQLGPGGRLVVPLDLRGVQVSVAMERDGDRWVSRSVAPCGFMRMRGPFAGSEIITVLRQDPYLVLGLPERRAVGDVLAALDSPAIDVPVAVDEPGSPFSVGMGVSLWLALHEPRWCAVTGKLGPGYGATAGIVEDGGIALLIMEQDGLIARGHGPQGAALAAALATRVTEWSQAGRPDATALRIEARPAVDAGPALESGGDPVPGSAMDSDAGPVPGSAMDSDAGPVPGAVPDGAVVIVKRHTTLVVSLR